jgi:hypothetical protein
LNLQDNPEHIINFLRFHEELPAADPCDMQWMKLFAEVVGRTAIGRLDIENKKLEVNVEGWGFSS